MVLAENKREKYMLQRNKIPQPPNVHAKYTSKLFLQHQDINPKTGKNPKVTLGYFCLHATANSSRSLIQQLHLHLY